MFFFCRWLTKFMHPDTMEFSDHMFLPTSTLAAGKLCPDQRRVPQLGSLLAESLVSAVLLVKLVVIVGVSAPKLIDLIAGPCYQDSKSHSLLMNCGAEIFSLEEFFGAVYAANGHYWRSFAILGNFLSPGREQSFLNGITMVGENSGASAYIPSAGKVASKMGETDPTTAATQLQDMFSGPGGRFGAMSSMMSVYMKTMINPIAEAHWIYRIASRIVVQSIEASRGKRTVGTVFWNVVTEGKVDFEELVTKRMYNTCGGFSLLAGYSSPLGKAILHFCFASVKATVATHDLVSLFMVDIPVMACVCKQSVGQPADYALHHCEVPDRTKVVLRRLLDSSSQCDQIVTDMTTNLKGLYDDVFGEMYAGTTYVASILDSFVSILDTSGGSGNCDNYETNPYVQVIIPQPVDYWRVCTKTDVCRVRCQQQVEAFERVRSSDVKTTAATQVVESMFFPMISDDVYTPFPDTGVLALMELDDCSMCPDGGVEDRCFMAGGFGGINAQFQVLRYCVPSSLGQGVSSAGSWETMGISGKSVSIQFVRTGLSGWTSMYSIVSMQDQLVQVCSRVGCVEFTPGDIDSEALGFDAMQVLDDVGVFHLRTVNGLTSYCLRAVGDWQFDVCPETNIWNQGLYHVVIDSQKGVLLLPFDDLDMQVCRLSGVAIIGCVKHTGFDYKSVPVKTRGKQSRVSQYVARGYGVFVTTDASSHWLRMLSVNVVGTTASVAMKNSMGASVGYEIQQVCAIDSCIGCKGLAVQRLCYAAQQCLIGRCIGTMVNTIRPLCAIGSAVQSSYNVYISYAEGAWLVISDSLVSILQLSTGGIQKPIAITWPDKAFFGTVCSMKDTLASQVSILTSAVNGIVQASVPMAQMRMGQAVDNRFLAVFSMTMTSMTSFIFHLTLCPLYALMAMQKTIVCETSSLVGILTGNNFLTIGDPSIQSIANSGTGRCLTAVHAENSNGANSGMDNAAGFISVAAQMITNMATFVESMPLENMKHSVDATFTWVLGVVGSLQDVLATIDVKK